MFHESCVLTCYCRYQRVRFGVWYKCCWNKHSWLVMTRKEI